MSQTLSGRAPIAVEAHTADDTLTVHENGTAHTNTGATGAITLTLPAATVGLHFYFRVGAAYELKIDPSGTEKMSATATGVPGAAGKYISADAAGELLHIGCFVAGEWSNISHYGTWTIES